MRAIGVTQHGWFHRLRFAETRGLIGALGFLFAIRWAGWLVALASVAFGALPIDNRRYEPVLLVSTGIYIAFCSLYIPLFRAPLRRALNASWGPQTDLRDFCFLDLAVSFAVLFASGGFNTPYYHYTNAALLVPAFLFGWRGSLLLCLTYLSGFSLIIATAGQGTDGPWMDRETFKLPGILLTPVMVVVVAQFLAWLVRRIEEQREQARRAFREASALYDIAYSVSGSDSDDAMVSGAIEALADSSRFSQLAIYQGEGDQLQLKVTNRDNDAPAVIRLTDASLAELASATGPRADRTRAFEFLLPILVQEKLWGVVAFDAAADDPLLAARLAAALASQLSLGLTKLSLGRQREELAALEERSRISREIHDGIAQSVYMLSLNLEKAADLAPTSEFSDGLRGLVGLAKASLLEVRQYIFDLKPLLSGDAGLMDALRGQAKEFTAVSGVPVEVSASGLERRLPIDVSTSIYRIAQEALANSFRHAHASHVRLRVSFTPDSVSLGVSDDGRGFTDGRENGHGLMNMRQRAEALGGSFRVASTTGSGTTVSVDLPLTPPVETQTSTPHAERDEQRVRS